MSFNNEDILTLAKAGFSAAQIAALNQVGAAPVPAPAPAPNPAPAPASTIDDVLKSVKDLTATFQNGFIVGSQQPKPVTAEDILANIINPPQPKKEV